MEWEKLGNWITENHVGKLQPMAPLSLYTSWKIGGPARLMVWPEEETRLSNLLRYCLTEGYPVRFLGSGTNLLVADEGVDALVVHTGGLNQLEWQPDLSPGKPGASAKVTAGAGLPLAHLTAAAAKRGYQGLEFAAGIPGSFGGALVMNAGAFGGQISDLTEFVRCMDAKGCVRILERRESAFGYRTSGLKTSGLLIIGGGLRLTAGNKDEIQALMSKHLEQRREKQPLDQPSGGSVFRNPAGEGAGRYIDRAGLKGLRVGDAQISTKHANFIVNLGNAKARDVGALMDIAKQEVRERFKVELENEIVYWE